MTPYTPWSTRSQFKAVEPRPIVVFRIQYQCRSAGYAGTDYARRPASGRSRYLPGMQFVAAVLRAPLTLFSLARIQFCQEPMRSLTKRFFSPVSGALHGHTQPRTGERSHGEITHEYGRPEANV